MKWQDVREKFPNEWVLMEALDSHSEDGYWIVEEMSVVDNFGDDGNGTWKAQNELLKKYPQRQFFFYHTGNEEIVIEQLNFRTFARVSQWHPL
jgi:hypothetical protein